MAHPEIKLSRNARRAVKAYGVDVCKKAYRMQLDRTWFETIASVLSLTTRQAYAAADAGRELCTEPLHAALMKNCASPDPHLAAYPTATIERLIARYQAVQKQHGVDSEFGRDASAGLKPLFEEMARRQKAGAL